MKLVLYERKHFYQALLRAQDSDLTLNSTTNFMFKLFATRLVPVLEAEDVAKKTINAILTNQKVCIIPGLFTLMNTLKS